MHSWRIAVAGAAVAVSVGTAAPAGAVASNPTLVSLTSSGSAFSTAAVDGDISDGGTKVAFVANQPSDPRIYVRNRSAHTTTLAYHGPAGRTLHYAFSGNGRHLAIATGSAAAGDGFVLRVRDTSTGGTRYLGPDFAVMETPSISDNGRYVGFSGRPAGSSAHNAYRWDVATGSLRKVTNGSAVVRGLISGDGRKMAYRAGGHVYARTIATGETVLVDARPDGGAGNSTISVPIAFSDDGRFVLYLSAATDLVPGTSACTSGCFFRRHLGSQGSRVVSVLPDGSLNGSGHADLSGDGQVVTWTTFDEATADQQTYVRRVASGVSRLASANAAGAKANQPAVRPTTNGDGSAVVFESGATNFGRTVSSVQVWYARSGV